MSLLKRMKKTKAIKFYGEANNTRNGMSEMELLSERFNNINS